MTRYLSQKGHLVLKPVPQEGTRQVDGAAKSPGVSVPKDGAMKPSDAPGFGIEIDPANLAPFAS